MADRFVWFDSFTRAGELLPSKKDKLSFYEGLMMYARTGEVPEMTPVAQALFVLAREKVDASIDADVGRNRGDVEGATVETERERRSRAARQGWEKRRKREACKNASDALLMQNNAMHKMHDLQYVRTDSHTDSFKNLNKKSESVRESVGPCAGANHARTSASAPMLFAEIPPDKPDAPPLADERDVQKVVGAAAAVGVRISPAHALKIIQSEIPRDWLSPPKSFLAFVAEHLRRNKKYRLLPEWEFRKLFLSAASNKRKGGDWTDLRDEYPAWLDDQFTREAKEREKREAEEREKAAREEWRAAPSPAMNLSAAFKQVVEKKRAREPA